MPDRAAWEAAPISPGTGAPAVRSEEYRGYTYGCMADGEIAVSLEAGRAPFWGVPRDTVKDINDDSEEN